MDKNNDNELDLGVNLENMHNAYANSAIDFETLSVRYHRMGLQAKYIGIILENALANKDDKKLVAANIEMVDSWVQAHSGKDISEEELRLLYLMSIQSGWSMSKRTYGSYNFEGSEAVTKGRAKLLINIGKENGQDIENIERK
jgi:hypothetical protein